MNAIENEMNNINVIAEEVINVEAQVLVTDYAGDESAEFYCYLKNTMNFLQEQLYSERDPTLFFDPDENGEFPFIQLEEMIKDLEQFKFAKRTWNRMKERTAGIETVKPLTQLEKAEHPDYKDWSCPKCLDYYKGDIQLKKHMETTQKCKDNHTRLFVKGLKNKVVKPKFYHTANVLNDLVMRAELYKKNIEPELEDEEIEEDEEDSESEEEYEDKFERQLLTEETEEEYHIVSISAEEQALNDAEANIYEEKDFDEDGTCNYCGWNTCQQQDHIEFCGYGNCGYILEKYGELELKRMFQEKYEW